MTDETAAKIMVVEDQEPLLAVVRRALERAGYEVIPAPSGVAMMSLIYSAKPDLIVLDIGLPDVDGATVDTGPEDRTSLVALERARARQGARGDPDGEGLDAFGREH